MRKIAFKSIVAGVLLSVLACPAVAQDEGGLVAVLDVAKVFKNNASFDAQLAQIRQEAEAQKKNIQIRQEDIRQRAQKVMTMPAGTQERFQQEAQVEQEQAKLRTQARQIETDLLKREAKIYYDAYVEMQQVVETIAKQYNITLVLRFDSSPIDHRNRNEVVKGVNRTVVYMNRLDLTGMVIEKMSPSTARVPTNNK